MYPGEDIKPFTKLDKSEAAHFLGVKPKTLSNWIALKIAPRHTKELNGRIYFELRDLEAYKRANTRTRAS